MVIKYFADIRLLAQCGEQRVTTAASTLHALLTELAAQHGAAFQKRIMEDGRISKGIVIMVNGQNVRYLAGLDTALKPEDDVSIFPMVAGGTDR